MVKDEPQFEALLLLVAFFFDFFAAKYLPPFDERFREVSGILTIAENVERNKAFDKLSDEEKERHVRAELERANSTETNADLNDNLRRTARTLF